MNRYIAKQDMIVRTQGGKRVKLEADVYYDGGYDFRDIAKSQIVVFVIVDGRKDEILFKAGNDFVGGFKYFGHVDKVEYRKVEQIKRPRIGRC